MLQTRSFRTLWAALFILTAASCAVEIKDQTWYGDKGPLGASGFHTLTTQTETLDKASWDKARFGMLCSVPQSFADVKAAIEKLCHVTNSCVYETKYLLETLDRLSRFQPPEEQK